jgi:hypothetical protein
VIRNDDEDRHLPDKKTPPSLSLPYSRRNAVHIGSHHFLVQCNAFNATGWGEFSAPGSCKERNNLNPNSQRLAKESLKARKLYKLEELYNTLLNSSTLSINSKSRCMLPFIQLTRISHIRNSLTVHLNITLRHQSLYLFERRFYSSCGSSTFFVNCMQISKERLRQRTCTANSSSNPPLLVWLNAHHTGIYALETSKGT